MVVKAYHADSDGTLQPYALYVPRDYRPGRPGGWPLVVALHGAFSDHRHNLRRVFGLDNRPGENDAEASRNELPLPDVPALVVSPYGRGELMGYDGLGGDDVMRVIADVRRAYDVDPDRISLTGLSMGGGGTWEIGLRHPELFAALAPVCAVADYGRMVQPADAALYDLEALERESPARSPATPRGCRCSSSTAPGTRPCRSRTRARWSSASGRSACSARTSATPSTRTSRTTPGSRRTGTRRCCARWPASGVIRRRRRRACRRRRLRPGAGAVRQERPRQGPHIYVYGTHGAADAVAAARKLAGALADWGPMVGARFVVKGDNEISADERARFSLVLVGAAPFNALAEPMTAPEAPPLGDRAFRAVTQDRQRPGHCTLQLGALTPRGFDRLKRFARSNRDGWTPEPNRPFILLGD